MKGKTKCPKCDHEFVLDIPDNKEKYSTICPKCKHQFIIKKSTECKDIDIECIWEEHGEPRKTILSSIKPRTDKPMISSILLTIVFIIGLFSSISIILGNNIFYNSTFKLINYSGFIIENNINIISLIIFVLSIIALIGSISSYKRNHVNIAIVTSFISIFSLGLYFIGSLLSFIALIIIIKSREEFVHDKKAKIF